MASFTPRRATPYSRSRNRTPVILAILSIILLYLIFFSSSATSTDFRATTEAALARKKLKNSPLRGDLSDEELTKKTVEELNMILEKLSAMTANLEDHDEVKDDSVAGRKTMKKPPYYPSKEKTKEEVLDDKDKPKPPALPKKNPSSDDSPLIKEIETNEKSKYRDKGEEKARVVLEAEFKKSPIIIFSKSYCPYSRRAKELLLTQYTITPPPHVVELDLLTEEVPAPKSPDDVEGLQRTTTLGKRIQDILYSLTGRRTVPNIMINSVSIGGCDDVVQMDEEGKLGKVILNAGGRRIVSVVKNEDLDTN